MFFFFFFSVFLVFSRGGVQEGVFFSVFFRGVVQTRPKPLLLVSWLAEWKSLITGPHSSMSPFAAGAAFVLPEQGFYCSPAFYLVLSLLQRNQ